MSKPTPEEIAEYLLSDIKAYKPNIKWLISRALEDNEITRKDYEEYFKDE